METETILIRKSENQGFISDTVFDAVRSIINKLQEEYGMEYHDSSYRDIYILTERYVNQLNDILATESVAPGTNPFGLALDNSYFNQMKTP